ncbi:helicase-related protein [Shewanella waksmanii]|uniref:helicase-related protein n=1 Tax=Shewanella waksmanii TaxID=213783 RepID=UPI003735A602
MSSVSPLPIDSLYHSFLTAIEHHHLVVESDTGSGKSTRLPLWSAEYASSKSKSKVLIVEPRRVACVALADYVATQTTLKVGYCVRFESSVEPDSDIVFVTPGVALRWLSGSSDLTEPLQIDDFAVVMIDEFHERRWDTDLLLAVLKVRQSHRLVITSATINAQRLSHYLSDDKVSAAHLLAEGKRFHVELKYAGLEPHHLPSLQGLEQRVVESVASTLQSTDGHILVFLPGKREIQLCIQACQRLKVAHEQLELISLHGGIELEQQQVVLSESLQQRVIFATNVAETSLTIPGVTAVIDSGLERRTVQRNGRTVLSLENISKASSEQRLGRAGRTKPGICIRLWGSHAPLIAVTPPDFQREELVEPMLAAATVSMSLQQLPFLDTLPQKSLLLASQRLMAMQAISPTGEITEHGRRLFPLPIDTQFSHLIAAMPDAYTRELMIDLSAALSIGGRLLQLPTDAHELELVKQWEPFGCDAYLLIKLIRGAKLEELSIDATLLKEAQQMAWQISSAIGVGQHDADCRHVNLLTDKSLRQRWLIAVINALPELAFVRRLKRQQALGNGFSEVQIGRDSRFEMTDAATTNEAAIVFDQFSLPGKGSKQTINLATCMAPLSLGDLCNAELGEIKLCQQHDQHTGDQVVVERVFAGRVIDSWQQAADDQQMIMMIVSRIESEQVFPGLYQQLCLDIDAWNLFIDLGLAEADAKSIELADYLPNQLSALGVSCSEDIALIEPEDLLFEGIPDWQRGDFDEKYPQKLVLADLKLTVEYLVKAKRITLHYLSGGRKAGPKRWELPSWQGWKISYKKASRVVEIK